MRVTNGMMVNNLMRNLSKNLNRMDKTQSQLSSGKQFVRPSDNPIGVSRSLRLNTEIATMNQYKRNADDVKSWLSTTEMAVDNIGEVLKRAKELTVQAANGTNNVDEKVAIKKEIEELRNQLIQIGNTTYAGSYLFSGYKTDKPLFAKNGTYDLKGDSPDPSSMTADELIEINIGMGDKIGENFVGQRIFGLYSIGDDLSMNTGASLKGKQSLTGSYISAPITASGSFRLTTGSGAFDDITLSGTYADLDTLKTAIEGQLDGGALDNPAVNVLVKDNRLVFESNGDTLSIAPIVPTDTVLSQIGMSNNQESVSRVDSGDRSQLIEIFDQLIADLGSNDTAGISSALTRIEVQFDNLNAIRAEIGVKTNRIELTTNRIEDDTVNLRELMSKNEDADIAEVIMNLKMEEYVYQASLSGGAKIIKPTLVDFIS